MNYCLVWFLVKSRQTDRKRCIWANLASFTGGLNNDIYPIDNPVWVMCRHDTGQGGWPACGLHGLALTNHMGQKRGPKWPAWPRITRTKPTQVMWGLVDWVPIMMHHYKDFNGILAHDRTHCYILLHHLMWHHKHDKNPSYVSAQHFTITLDANISCMGNCYCMCHDTARAWCPTWLASRS